MASDRLELLLASADDLALGRITWTARGGSWECHCSVLPFPHQADGSTPEDALDELIRFARRIMR